MIPRSNRYISLPPSFFFFIPSSSFCFQLKSFRSYIILAVCFQHHCLRVCICLICGIYLRGMITIYYIDYYCYKNLILSLVSLTTTWSGHSSTSISSHFRRVDSFRDCTQVSTLVFRWTTAQRTRMLSLSTSPGDNSGTWFKNSMISARSASTMRPALGRTK